MLFTKCILSESSIDDGLRISVMSRHTLNDGVTPDSRIKVCHFHIPKLGPSPRLIGAYYRDEIDWCVFEKKYLIQIRSKLEIISKIKFFAEYALGHTVTFLCVEEKPDFCHRRLLAQECKRFKPNLQVEYR
jgi:uncharacterized protein YeaO (DUF488 family)